MTMSKRQHRSQENLRNLSPIQNRQTPENRERNIQKGIILLEGMNAFSPKIIFHTVMDKLRKPTSRTLDIIMIKSDRHSVTMERLKNSRFRVTSDNQTLKPFISDKRGAIEEVSARIATSGMKVV